MTEIEILTWPAHPENGAPYRATPLSDELLDENGGPAIMGRGVDFASAVSDLRYLSAKHLNVAPSSIEFVGPGREERSAIRQERRRFRQAVSVESGLDL